MRLKPEVVADGAAWQIGYAIGIADTLRENLVVTSIKDGKHNPGSLHPSGYAVDFRITDLHPMDADAFYEKLKAILTPLGFDVVFENKNATAATSAPHIHVEYDEKPGRTLMRRT